MKLSHILFALSASMGLIVNEAHPLKFTYDIDPLGGRPQRYNGPSKDFAPPSLSVPLFSGTVVTVPSHIEVFWDYPRFAPDSLTVTPFPSYLFLFVLLICSSFFFFLLSSSFFFLLLSSSSFFFLLSLFCFILSIDKHSWKQRQCYFNLQFNFTRSLLRIRQGKLGSWMWCLNSRNLSDQASS